ncbi:MAG: class I SAM-dependent methyltransferase [Faecalibacillus sp.]
MKELEEYYGKFCEDKRLTRKHGQVEFRTSMKYIHDYLKAGDRILDIGAGTGRYSVALSNEGYEVDAIELVKYNLGMLKAKKSKVRAYQGSALDLSRYDDETFDMTLLFGPMYHLFTREDRIKALSEAKRVTKTNGLILVAYVMNDYSVLVHGFRDGYIKESIIKGKIDKDFHTQTSVEDLYSYVRIEDINSFNEEVKLERIKIIAADGPADYMRPILNKMDDETFELFMQYHLSTCERADLIGASSHTLDILKKATV